MNVSCWVQFVKGVRAAHARSCCGAFLPARESAAFGIGMVMWDFRRGLLVSLSPRLYRGVD